MISHILFIFTPYNYKKSSEIVKPKMKKIRPANADLQKLLKTKKMFFSASRIKSIQLIDHLFVS